MSKKPIKLSDKTILLNFICRDNEKTIQRMLESVQDIICGVAFCDTGSKDNTIRIIRDFCDNHNLPHAFNVIQFNNFATSRNMALEAARAKSLNTNATHILFLDTDETLEIEDINEWIPDNDVIGIRTVSGQSMYYRDLLIRADLKMKWKGAAHEFIQVQEKIWSKGRMKKVSAVLYPKDPGTDHILRNYRLLEAAENKTAREYFYLGESASDLGAFKTAIKYYHEGIIRDDFEEQIYFALVKTAMMYEMLNDKTKALEFYYKAMERRSQRDEAPYRAAVLLMEQKSYPLAKALLRSIIDVPKERKMDKLGQDKLWVDYTIYKYKANFQLSVIAYYGDQDYFESVKYGRLVEKKAEKFEKEDPSTFSQNRINMAFYQRARNDKTEQKAFVFQMPPAFDGLGDHLFMSRLPEIAHQHGYEAVLVSIHNKYKTQGTEDIYQSDPNVLDITDMTGTFYDRIQDMHNVMNGQGVSTGYDMIQKFLELHDMNLNAKVRDFLPKYHLDPLQINVTKKVFDKKGIDLTKSVVFDPNWKHNSGLSNELVQEYVDGIQNLLIIAPFEDTNYAYRLPNTSISPYRYIKPLNLREYAAIISLCKEFICMMSGGAVLSVALEKRATVLDSRKTPSYHKFEKHNKHLYLDELTKEKKEEK